MISSIPKKLGLLFGAPLAAILILFIIVFSMRFSDFVAQSRPMGNFRIEKEVNSGIVDITGLGIFPRNERVLLASDGSDSDFAIAGTRSRDTLSVIELPSGRVAEVLSFDQLGLFQDLPTDNKEIFLFDLELSRTRLFVSLVATDRKPQNCDSYVIFEIPVKIDHTLGKGKKVWASSTCRSVVSRDYGWPDFTGRIAYVNGFLYLTSGFSSMNMIDESYPEPAMSGVASSLEIELKENDLFGSITQIDPASGDSRVFARGFRSPAGITFRGLGSKTQIWVSDHGSKGGDELNLIENGGNYGWPFVSFGMSYGLAENPNVPTAFNTHDGYLKPKFFWTPSIAPSQLLAIDGDLFDRYGWRSGDLILGTLKDRSIRVLSIGEENQVLKDERIYLGHRIRDISRIHSGLLLSTDDGMILILKPSHNNVSSTKGMFPPIDKPTWLDLPGVSRLKHLSDVIIDILNSK